VLLLLTEDTNYVYNQVNLVDKIVATAISRIGMFNKQANAVTNEQKSDEDPMFFVFVQ
jgi:hypothetical protein